jgi:hypothetical protein
LAVDEITVKFKERIIFRQYIPKKHKCFGIKIFKLCDEAGYTYNMKVYLGRDRTRANQDVTATHATVRDLCRRIEGVGHKLYKDNFFSSPDLTSWRQKNQLLRDSQTKSEGTAARLMQRKASNVRVRG